MCSVHMSGCVCYCSVYQLLCALSLSASVLGWAPAVVRTTPESRWLYRQIHNHTHTHTYHPPTVTIHHLPTASLPVPLGTCSFFGGRGGSGAMGFMWVKLPQFTVPHTPGVHIFMFFWGGFWFVFYCNPFKWETPFSPRRSAQPWIECC